jgi:regulatory subunit for Cdc7p protein kinase
VIAGSKRVRTTSAFDDGPDKDRLSRQAARERKIAEKEQQKAEFRNKYRRAFPSWTFYFDADHIEPDRAAVSSLDARIQGLGGVCNCTALRECR